MNRLQTRQRQGRRELIAIILLVVPLVAIGYYLAAIEVAVDPPPDPVADSTPTVVRTPVSSPGDALGGTGTPSSGDAAATPTPGTSGMTPARQHGPNAILHGTNHDS